MRAASHAEPSFELRVHNLPGLKRNQVAHDGAGATGFSRVKHLSLSATISFIVHSAFQPASDVRGEPLLFQEATRVNC
jgi:hypothetical protein